MTSLADHRRVHDPGRRPAMRSTPVTAAHAITGDRRTCTHSSLDAAGQLSLARQSCRSAMASICWFSDGRSESVFISSATPRWPSCITLEV